MLDASSKFLPNYGQLPRTQKYAWESGQNGGSRNDHVRTRPQSSAFGQHNEEWLLNVLMPHKSFRPRRKRSFDGSSSNLANFSINEWRSNCALGRKRSGGALDGAGSHLRSNQKSPSKLCEFAKFCGIYIHIYIYKWSLYFLLVTQPLMQESIKSNSTRMQIKDCGGWMGTGRSGKRKGEETREWHKRCATPKTQTQQAVA